MGGRSPDASSGRSQATASVQDTVRRRVLGLPARFRHESANGLVAEWDLRVGSESYSISVAGRECVVREGPALSPKSSIAVEPETWLAIDAGRLTGPQAFLEGRLQLHGNLDLAVRLQTLFRPHGRARRRADLDQVDVTADGVRLSAYVAGRGEPVLMLHGLGATKITWVPVLSALADRYRLVIPDLPGHGLSEKPRGAYSPRFHARVLRRLLDELGIDRAAVIGNSLGGRVALELALRAPRRVGRLALLDPSVPGIRWAYLLGFARIVPSELGALPIPLRERWIRVAIRRLFADPDRLAPESFSLAAAEFIRLYADPTARMAFLASLRHIVTERPDAFFSSLRRVKQPALVVFGEMDRLVPARLGARLAEHLPNARLVVLPGVGHVPQFEATEETVELLLDFLSAKR